MRSVKELLNTMNSKEKRDVRLVTEAYNFAKGAHKNQKRYSGEPYFSHLAEVAYYLARAGMDTHTVAAGLLHDTIEDVDVPPKVIREKFDTEILHLVEGVTKLGALRYRGLARHTESLRKLFAATAKDIRVLIIKVMDRLHNAKTLEHVPKNKRKRIAIETLEIYAPIADRLGMGVVKRELEDAVFPYTHPREYKKMQGLLKERHAETERRLKKTENALKRHLAEANIRTFRTESRIKGLYSLFMKLQRKKWDETKIHDILALRIIVPDVATCYTILGIIHGQWRPVPGKIKDYIAFPKPNGYQSIHTTIYTGDGGTLEIQIRTEAIHREAQYGIASHFSYKEKSGTSHVQRGSGIEWMRQFVPTLTTNTTQKDAQKEETNKKTRAQYNTEEVPSWVRDLAETQGSDQHEKFLEDIKSDFFSHRVFVFTPDGDVIDLPVDATPVDFAYAIHSDIGDHMTGAKVSGKMISIDTKLRNGDIVEIVTKKSAKPTRKWIEHAKTTLAKRHIKSALQRER